MRYPWKAAEYSNGKRALAISAAYAALVLGVAVFVLIANFWPPNFAGIWLFIVTLPSSLLVLLIPAQGTLLTVCVTLGGLVQAWLLWLGLRGRRRSDLPSG
jgi:hypothetical protein